MTLTEFLLDRIAEDEAMARAALAAYDTPGGINAEWWTRDELAARDLDAEDIDHIARWSPDRVLAECEAKRRIVEDYVAYADDYRTAPSEFAEGRRHAALLAVTRLAEACADHPDYRDEWRP